jgi:hypothetical protein
MFAPAILLLVGEVGEVEDVEKKLRRLPTERKYENRKL